jgi:hypothetical protein
MSGSKAVKERIEELIAQASDLSQDNANVHNQSAWLVAAQNVVQLVCPRKIIPTTLTQSALWASAWAAFRS